MIHIPNNFTTHRDSWRKAIEIARGSARTHQDKEYWQHELEAYDRAFKRLLDDKEESYSVE